MEAPTLLAVCCFFLSSKGVVDAALDLNVPSEIIAVKGGLAVFEISYTESGGDTFNSFALNKGQQNVFTAPLAIQSHNFPNGSFSGPYETRASTNYYSGRTQFTITLRGITTSDQGEYKVKFTKNRNVAVTPVLTQLVLDVLPSTPSISGAPRQSGTGPAVLICTANLGKPQASMVWSRRIGSGAYKNITENVKMTTASNNDGTTNGNSTLRVNLDTADDGVQFRCQVSNRQATLYAETEAVKETETIKPTGSGEGGDTTKPTGSGEGGDTVKPTENGKGGGSVKPTGNGDGGASAGRHNIPNKIVLGTAFVVMAKAYTTF